MPSPNGKSSSIAFYIASAFVLTAAMTVLITAGAIIVVWNVNRGFILEDEDIYMALLAAGCVALVLSAGLGLFFANSVAQPIQRVSKAAAAIKEGDLTARTGLHGDDELSSLGESFDEMAEAIERDRDLERQLIGDVAHELRTPLMAIQATVEAIQDGVFPADEEHLDTISAETRRLGRLVEALLHLNRLENGTTVVKQELVDISALISELALTHEALIEASGITFSTSIEDGMLVDGDRDLLTQAVANLLSNAVRYTPEGGSISITMMRQDGFASIRVKDTGVGISEEDLSHVFSRFWRADTARTSVGGGLGIGLALVREVADQHRGHVGVESVLGEGSTFIISIPLSTADRAHMPASQREARRAAKAARREAEKQRKELKKQKERELKQQRRAEEKARKLKGRSAQQQLTFFGIRMPLPSKKDDDGQTGS